MMNKIIALSILVCLFGGQVVADDLAPANDNVPQRSAAAPQVTGFRALLKDITPDFSRWTAASVVPEDSAAVARRNELLTQGFVNAFGVQKTLEQVHAAHSQGANAQAAEAIAKAKKQMDSCQAACAQMGIAPGAAAKLASDVQETENKVMGGSWFTRFYGNHSTSCWVIGGGLTLGIIYAIANKLGYIKKKDSVGRPKEEAKIS
jgi:hypothetical protein